MGKYVLIGRPAPGTPESTAVEGQQIGDKFSADFSKQQEQALVSAGVVQVISEPKPQGSQDKPRQRGSSK